MDENNQPKPINMSQDTPEENVNPNPEPEMPEEKPMGPVLAGIIIIIILVVSAFYVWGTRPTSEVPQQKNNQTPPTEKASNDPTQPEAPVDDTTTDNTDGIDIPDEELQGDQVNIDLINSIDSETEQIVTDTATAELDALEGDTEASSGTDVDLDSLAGELVQ